MTEGHLTRRQRQVACLVAEGRAYSQIAEKLGISPITVSRHIQHIYKVLGIKSRVQLMRWVYEQGWITIEDRKVTAYKTLFAALALSPNNKAIMAITKRHRVIVERHWTPSNLCYSVHVVDIAKRDIAYATGAIVGTTGLAEWMRRIEKSINVSIDINKKRWLTLEELERSKV